MRYSTSEGFTIIELLVALVIGTVLLGAAYQLQVSVLKDSADAQRRAQASGIAYDILRQYQANTAMVTTPCTPHTDTPAMPSYSTLSGSSASVTVTCPYGSSSSLSLVTVTVAYNGSTQTQQVYRAVATRPS